MNMEEPQPLPPCSSGRTSCCDSNSPEFEFWMVRNPYFPQPNLLTADELFSDGVLLSFHQLHLSNEAPPSQPEASESDQVPEPKKPATELGDLSAGSSLTSSKSWTDIFRKNDKKSSQERDSCAKERRREKKNSGAGGGGAGNGASAAELNINIWPFSRSRSAGNGGTRPRPAASTRKVSSAPCSRSNSRGESKSRKWPSSPGRAGIPLGRSSPVWQVLRVGGGRRSSEAAARSAEKVVKKDGNESPRKIPIGGGPKARVLSLKVPLCLGYRQQLSSTGDGNSAGGVPAAVAGGGENAEGVSGEGARASNLFNIKSLFNREDY